MGKHEKPPQGIMPRWMWTEERMVEIELCINRYKSVQKEIPLVLLQELSDHFVWLDSYRREQKNKIKKICEKCGTDLLAGGGCWMHILDATGKRYMDLCVACGW